MNTFGRHFRVTSFGESHGPALGVVIDGCPAGVTWEEERLELNLRRRRPGQSATVTSRQEADQPELLSGVFEGRTLGTPIALIVRNHDARSQDYERLAPRIGHADDVWLGKFGHSDPRGGGRASGRETLSRVLAGSVAEMALSQLHPDLKVSGFARSIGPISVADDENVKSVLNQPGLLDTLAGRMPDAALATEVETLLTRAKSEGESYGGLAEIWIENPPPYLGQPVFHKLKADLAAALMGVGATFSVNLGAPREDLKGTQFHTDANSENYGGIRGGLSTGEMIVLQVGFKPTSSIKHVAQAGRHDPCILPRAIPVLEAMVNLVLMDHVLWARLDRLAGE